MWLSGVFHFRHMSGLLRDSNEKTDHIDKALLHTFQRVFLSAWEETLPPSICDAQTAEERHIECVAPLVHDIGTTEQAPVHTV